MLRGAHICSLSLPGPGSTVTEDVANVASYCYDSVAQIFVTHDTQNIIAKHATYMNGKGLARGAFVSTFYIERASSVAQERTGSYPMRRKGQSLSLLLWLEDSEALTLRQTTSTILDPNGIILATPWVVLLSRRPRCCRLGFYGRLHERNAGYLW
jgi:hypothetical protein